MIIKRWFLGTSHTCSSIAAIYFEQLWGGPSDAKNAWTNGMIG